MATILCHRLIRAGHPGLWLDGAPTDGELAVYAERGRGVQYAYDGPQEAPTLAVDDWKRRAPWGVIRATVNGTEDTVCYELHDVDGTRWIEARIFGREQLLELTPELRAAIERDIEKGGMKQ